MLVNDGGRHGAAVLGEAPLYIHWLVTLCLSTGAHLEGPFINQQKKGAHSENFIQSHLSPSAVMATYGCLDNVRIITLAPELEGAEETIKWLTRYIIIM